VAEPTSGFQPRNTPAERRAFFEQKRQIDELKALVAALTTRVETLEAGP
jgi:hypothetical protein